MQSVQLLVSVRNPPEAILAATTKCVDILDIKEPNNGSLGAACPSVWKSIADAFTDESPECHGNASHLQHSPRLSVAMGELSQSRDLDDLLQSESLKAFHFAKVGLADCGHDPHWRQRWIDWHSRLPATTSPVAVAYADWESAHSPHPEEVVESAIALGGAGVLLDTQGKSSPIFGILPLPLIESLLHKTHRAGLWFAIAGSLDAKTIPTAALMGPDVIAVRGAACDGPREGTICPNAIYQLSRLIAPSKTH